MSGQNPERGKRARANVTGNEAVVVLDDSEMPGWPRITISCSFTIEFKPKTKGGGEDPKGKDDD